MTRLFVTGGSRGIGAALVRAAARRGFAIAFTWRENEASAQRVAAEAETLGAARVLALRLDVRDAEAVDAAADRVLEQLGGVDAVVCNAGLARNGLAYTLSDEDWNAVLDTNLTGAFRVCRAFLPELVAQRSGRIVLLSSVVAAGGSGQAAYAASKAGLHGLAATLAKEYGPKGVTTNIVVPGYFDTDMTRDTMSDDVRSFALSFCPQRRMGELDELCEAILFLCSAAGYVNGATLRVTGGLDWAP